MNHKNWKLYFMLNFISILFLFHLFDLILRERHTDRESVCERDREREQERQRECVCVCVREIEREIKREREKER